MGCLSTKPEITEQVESAGKDVDEPRKDVSNTQDDDNQQEISSPRYHKDPISQITSNLETTSASQNHVSVHVQGSVIFSFFSIFFFSLIYESIV